MAANRCGITVSTLAIWCRVLVRSNGFQTHIDNPFVEHVTFCRLDRTMQSVPQEIFKVPWLCTKRTTVNVTHYVHAHDPSTMRTADFGTRTRNIQTSVVPCPCETCDFDRRWQSCTKIEYQIKKTILKCCEWNLIVITLNSIRVRIIAYTKHVLVESRITLQQSTFIIVFPIS